MHRHTANLFGLLYRAIAISEPNGVLLETDTGFDWQRYRTRIGLDTALCCDKQTLLALIEHHARAIPFENVDTLAGRCSSLDFDTLHSKMVLQRRGGYCYEQNSLFMYLLRDLGFEVEALEARALAGSLDPSRATRNHMALEVVVDGKRYLVDVGFGSSAPLAPIEFGAGAQRCSDGTVYRLTAELDCWLLQIDGGGSWHDTYRVEPSRPRAVDLEVGHWYVSHHPEFFLRRNLVVGRAVTGGRLTLFNRQLKRRHGATGEVDESSLSSRAEVGDVLRDGFNLDICDSDLDHVMAVLDGSPEGTPQHDRSSGS